VRDHAELVGHSLEWETMRLGRRQRSSRRGGAVSTASLRDTPSPLAALFVRMRRTFGKA
jgi:hypothetical protein